MIPHHWNRAAADNGSADPNADLRPGRPANTVLGAIRGIMATGAAARDDAIGELVATLGANNVYGVLTNEGLIDRDTGINGIPAAITKPFLLRLSFATALTGAAANVPHLVVDGYNCGPILDSGGGAIADGDLTPSRSLLVLGDMASPTDTQVTRVRVLDTLPSDMPKVDVDGIYARIESRGQVYADSAVNRSVTSGRWVFAGQKSCFEQPGTGGFISPFGGHTMHCDYWTFQFLDANGVVQCAPYAFRFRLFQVYITNQGWVTCGAVS